MLIKIIGLVGLVAAAVGFALALYYKIQRDKTQLAVESSETSLYLYNITFSEQGFKNKLKNISLAIMKRLSFDYVSFFIIDKKKNVGIIESTVPEYEHPELLAFTKELLLTKSNPQILFSENGFLPHGSDRGIKYAYFIPLIENDQTTGGIVLEKENLDKVDRIENNVFNSIVSAVSRAFSFIIFAYNLNESAYKDVLTGAQNRMGLETLDDELNGTYTAVMCDIDFFKNVNDTYGHAAGDEVIKLLASILIKNVRPADMVFRMGGEEFLMLLKDIDSDMIIKRINDIRRSIEESNLDYDSKSIKVTASFGLCDTSYTHSLQELIKSADKALYYSKNNGRNRATIYRHDLF